MPAPAAAFVASADIDARALSRTRPGAGRRRPSRGVLLFLAALAFGAGGLTGCSGDDAPKGSVSPSETGSRVPSGWVAAATPTVTVNFPADWERINDANLGDGLAARSPEVADGTRAVVAVRILDVGRGDAQAIGDSPATAAADQTLSQLQESGVKGATIVSGPVADRPGWVISWQEANKRDPLKRVYRHVWGVADVGTRQFVVVTSQALPAQWDAQKVDDILASIRLPLALAPTTTPTRTPDGSGDVVLDGQGGLPGDAPMPSPSPSASPSK